MDLQAFERQVDSLSRQLSQAEGDAEEAGRQREVLLEELRAAQQVCACVHVRVCVWVRVRGHQVGCLHAWQQWCACSFMGGGGGVVCGGSEVSGQTRGKVCV